MARKRKEPDTQHEEPQVARADKQEGPELILDRDYILDNVDRILKEYAARIGVEDLRKASQTVYNGGLMSIGWTLFKHNKDAFRKDSPGPAGGKAPYDNDTLEFLLSVYAYLCNVYDKVFTAYGFSLFSNLPLEYCEGTYSQVENVSFTAYRLAKTLRHRSETAAGEYIVDGRHNPVGTFGYLNRYFQWSQPGVTREVKETAVLQVQELPKLLD